MWLITSRYRTHIIVRNYRILLIIPTPPMFAAEIERGRVTRADGGCLRQARSEVQVLGAALSFLKSFFSEK